MNKEEIAIEYLKNHHKGVKDTARLMDECATKSISMVEAMAQELDEYNQRFNGVRVSN